VRPLQTFLQIKQSERRREASEISRKKRSFRIGLGSGIVFFLILVGGVAFASIYYMNITKDLPSILGLDGLLNPENGQLLEPTRIYDRSEQNILLELSNPGVERKFVALDSQISPIMIQLTTASLQPDFWDSPGYATHSILDPQPQTIAEQLVNQLLLWQEPDSSTKALRMRLLAAQVVKQYGKSQVLEWYLNSANFGHLAYGVENAARYYFAKPAADLSLEESALLIALIHTPSLNPLDAPAAAIENQQKELKQFLQMGIISAQTYEKAISTPLEFNPKAETAQSSAPAFTNLILNQLAPTYPLSRMELGGLRVVTTLDFDLQNALRCTTQTQIARLKNQSDPQTSEPCEAARLLPALPSTSTPLPDSLSASGVILDSKNGQILAFTGNQLFSGETNIQSGHPAGSLLSPFVALAGFVRGYSPASLVWDIPASLPESFPEFSNPDSAYHGPVRLRTAIANDYLAPIAQLFYQIGADNVWRTAQNLGLISPTEAPDPEVLLYEGGTITPLEIAQSYGTIASLGTRYGMQINGTADLQPYTILFVEDVSGRRWFEKLEPDSKSVISPQLAYLVHDVLSDDAARRVSLGYPNLLEISQPSAAKIGQVADKSQVWTVGYTSQLLSVVWMGVSETDDTALDTRYAAGIWHAIMQSGSRDLPVENWQMPQGISTIKVCDPSGLLPTDLCPNVVNEIFIAGTEPVTTDTLYRSYQINRETNLLATIYTPPELVIEKTFLNVPPEAQAWAVQANLPLPPQNYDAIQSPVSNPQVAITDPAIYTYVNGRLSIRGVAGGDNFSSYQLQVGQGINPQNWVEISSSPKRVSPAGILGEWDTTRQSDGLYALRLLVVRSNQQIDVSVIQVTVDNTPPIVRIKYPFPNEIIEKETSQKITLQADVQDQVGVDHLDWFIDDRLVSTTSRAPYDAILSLPVGKHSLQIKAYDPAGNEGLSETVDFQIKLP